MLSCRLSCESPWYLLLLAVLPVLWCFSFRSLAGLGPVRRLAVLAARTLVVTLLILAAAELQLLRNNEKLTVIYLLDQSLSIPEEQRRAMLQYVTEEIRKHRGHDRVSVIVFGRDAVIEVPPLDDNVVVQKVESSFGPEYTNLAGAMKLAQATFPEDAAKRIVVVSDGNQNRGNALEQAESAAAAGIGIDAIPVYYQHRADVAVQRVVVPGEVRKDQAFNVRVVLNNTQAADHGAPGDVGGRLVLTRTVDDQSQVVSDQRVTLPPGKTVFTVPQTLDSSNFYTYEARFVPERSQDDVVPQNDRATAFTRVQGKGQVLLIESVETRGEHDLLVQRVRQQGLEVTVRNTANLFSSLAELQPYDAVILANVPRATAEMSFSNEQIDMLVSNTREMGAGLVMLGGPESFGAGGWTGTELEKAMPVDFQITNAKVVPQSALVMVLDKSGSMAGQKIEMSKAAAIEAARMLSPNDYVGVVAFDMEAYRVAPMQRVDAQAVARRIQRLAGSGGTNMEPGMVAGYQDLRKASVAIKHMIVLTDGMTAGSGYPALAARMRNEGMTVSCVAVGADADKRLMLNIATAGGGKYYDVKSPRAIPRIFQTEVRRVARPLLYEDKAGVGVKVNLHEMSNGLSSLPPVTGYVLTQRKASSLVEVVLGAAKPAGEDNSTLLAGWPVGAGKAVAFTSDDGTRWTQRWTDRAVYDKLFGQIVRWAMRPVGDQGKFIVATEQSEGQVRVVVNAVDKNNEFLNFLAMHASVVGPDLKGVPLTLEQTAPGRYVGAFPASAAGSYFVNIVSKRPKRPDEMAGPEDKGMVTTSIRTGANVPYSDEFRELATNEALLGQLAAQRPKGGEPGQILAGIPGEERQPSLSSFRHDLAKATSSQYVWHYLLLLGSCLFFGDVFIRRVQVSMAWVPPLAGRARDWVLRRQPQRAAPEYVERLRSRKAEVAGKLEQLRAAARFEFPEDTAAEIPVPREPADPAEKPPSTAAPSITVEPKAEEESYTERLLRAKKRTWQDRWP